MEKGYSEDVSSFKDYVKEDGLGNPTIAAPPLLFVILFQTLRYLPRLQPFKCEYYVP